MHFKAGMAPGVNVISGKASEASNMQMLPAQTKASPLQEGVLGDGAPCNKFLGSIEHTYWLKIDLNATKIITV